MKEGSLVICIKTVEAFGTPKFRLPQKDELFVVAEILLCPACKTHDLLHFEEIPNVGFDAEDFREVQPPVKANELLKRPLMYETI